MTMTRLMGAAAVAALVAGAANAQTPQTPPTEQTPPAQPPAVQAAPPAVTPPTAAAPSAATPATPATPAQPGVAAATPATPATPAPAALVARGDVVETLKADGRFKTLIKALEATNMTGVLKTNRNLTVFAPTDAAFAALPPGELDRLMKDPPALQKLLTYHVVNATVDSAKIRGARGGVKTVAGSELMLDGSGESLKANAAAIVQADVRPTNGVIHVVDRVLTPEAAPSMAAAAAAGSDAAATTASQTPASPPAPAAPPADKPDAAPEKPAETGQPPQPKA